MSYLLCVAQMKPETRWKAETIIARLAATAQKEFKAVAHVSVGARSRWKLTTPANVPAAPGCYALYRGTTLIYIGSSCNLQNRLASHWKDLKRWNVSRAEPLYVKTKISRRRGDWLMIEYRLISRLHPPENSTQRHVPQSSDTGFVRRA